MTCPNPSHDALESSAREKPSLAIRPLADHQEFLQCIRLQKETWGEGFSELVPIAILKATARIGGVVAGAFDPEGEMMGFVFGMTGIKEGRPVHWSDMLAVRADARDAGIGRRLKEYQRETVAALGVDEIYWTYDPLVAKNAHLNLNRLGARPIEYVPEMYGAETDSMLHRGVGTDRFVVCWTLSGAHGDRRGTQNEQPREVLASPLLNPLGPDGGPGARREVDFPMEPFLRVQIPLEIQAIQSTSVERAWRWRQSTREAFLLSLAEGYEVIGFYRCSDREHGCYVLHRGKEG